VGYAYCVFGGGLNPVFDSEWKDVPFSQTRHRVIRSSFLSIDNPTDLYYYVTEANVVTLKGTGPRVFFRWEGEVMRYGDYYS